MFTDIVNHIHDYRLIPVALKDSSRGITEDNLEFGFDYAVKLKRFSSKKGIDLAENDICRSVLKKATDFDECI